MFGKFYISCPDITESITLSSLSEAYELVLEGEILSDSFEYQLMIQMFSDGVPSVRLTRTFPLDGGTIFINAKDLSRSQIKGWMEIAESERFFINFYNTINFKELK